MTEVAAVSAEAPVWLAGGCGGCPGPVAGGDPDARDGLKVMMVSKGVGVRVGGCIEAWLGTVAGAGDPQSTGVLLRLGSDATNGAVAV